LLDLSYRRLNPWVFASYFEYTRGGLSRVSGDDVRIETAVVAFGLSARVVHAEADGVELDRATHHLSRLVAEAAEEVVPAAPSN
jgi:hypothetical protein